jgi:cell division protease FtsH
MPKSRPSSTPIPAASELTLLESLADRLVHPALGERVIARLSADEQLVLAVAAPSAWITVVGEAIEAIAPSIALFVVSGRRSADEEAEELALDRCARGDSVLFLAERLDAIPSSILSVADARAVVREPDGELLRAFVRDRTGADPGPLPPRIAAGAAPRAIVACFRRGEDAAAAVERLRALGPPPSTLPPGPTLDDLHGFDGAMAWAAEMTAAVEALRRGEIGFAAIAAPGAVLAGPPGTGKTTFVKAFARSLALPLVETGVGAWFAGGPGYLDSIIKAATAAFAAAQAARGADGLAVLFVDEIDAIPNRQTMSERNRDYWTPVVTHILQLSERASPTRDGIILIGATNDGARLDAALVRPGRFEQILEIGLPDAEALAGILGMHAPEILEADRAALGHLLVGRSGAEVEAVVRAARRVAGARPLSASDVRAVVLRPDGLSDAERRLVAVHESGHALVAAALGLDLTLVSIVPDGAGRRGAAGFEASAVVVTRGLLETLATVALGGRAADEVAGAGPHAGARADLLRATRLVAEIHLATGLGEELVAHHDAHLEGLVAADPRIRALVEADLRRLLQRATAIVSANRAALERLVALVVERRIVTGAQARTALGRLRLPVRRGRAAP